MNKINKLRKLKAYLLGTAMLAGLGLPTYDAKAYNPTTTIESEADDTLTSSTFSIEVDYSKEISNEDQKNIAEYATFEGIMAGYPDQTFQPERLITRAELASVLVHTAYIPDANEEFNISDLTNYEWTQRYANVAVGNDLMALDNGKFNPSAVVTKGEVALSFLKLIATGNEELTSKVKDIQSMTDLNQKDKEAVILLLNNGYEMNNAVIADEPMSRINVAYIAAWTRNELYPAKINTLTK